MWSDPCGKQQSSDIKQCRSYCYFQHRSLPFELKVNITMPLVARSVLQHFFHFILACLCCFLILAIIYVCLFYNLEFSFRFSDC